MDRLETRPNVAPYIFAASLVLGVLVASEARAPTWDKGGSTPPPGGAAAAKGDRPGAKAAAGVAAGAAQGQAKPRKGPSEDYQESIRRTVERRRQRRAGAHKAPATHVRPVRSSPGPCPPHSSFARPRKPTVRSRAFSDC